MIRLVMIVVRLVVAVRRSLLKKVVHPVGRGVDQKEQKRSCPKRGGAAGDRRRGFLSSVFHGKTTGGFYTSAPSMIKRRSSQWSCSAVGFLPRVNKTISTTIKSAADVSTMVAAEETSK